MKFAPLILMLVVSPVSVSGQGTTKNLSEAANDPLMEEALSALYDLDYKDTKYKVRKFMKKSPQNPLGPLSLAGIIWWQVAAEAAAEDVSDALYREFDESVKLTLKIAKPLRKSDDIAERSDGTFAAGMALGLQGQMRLTRGQYIRAYRSGKKAIRFLKKTVKKEPRYYDAYFGLGLFDYQVAVLPGVIRLGAKMLLRGTGNRKRGLRRIRLSVQKGSFSSRQAAGLLLTLYILNEKDYRRALTLSEKLVADFPNSPYYAFLRVQILHLTGRDTDSYRSAKELFDRFKDKPGDFRRKQIGTICGLFAADCFTKKNLEIALSWLSMAVVAADTSGNDAAWTAYLYLYRGMVKDMLHRRKGARTDYKKAAELPDFLGTRGWANYCRVNPCGRKETVRYMRGL